MAENTYYPLLKDMPESDLSDQQLIALLARRDSSACAALMQRYGQTLYYTAYSLLQDKEEARDCVQETFIRLWQKKDLSGIDNVKQYLNQIARFVAIKVLKKNIRNRHLSAELVYITEGISRPQAYDVLFEKDLRCFRRLLPNKQEQMFRMSREEGMTYHEIAARLNISPKTIEKWMAVSITALRFHCEQMGCVIGPSIFSSAN